MSLRKFIRAAAAVAAFLAIDPANAQQRATPAPPQRPAHAVALGVIADSLHGGPLVGAFVSVDGTDRVGVSNERGVFLIDSIPPGSYRLGVMHAVLDTVAISVVTPTMTFAAGDTVRMVLATPSAQTIVRMKCGNSPLGPALLTGVVTDSDTDAPVEGATVVVAWMETQAGAAIGLRRVPRQRVTRTQSDGTYRICGLPDGLRAEIFAHRDDDTTAVLPLEFDRPFLSIRTLVLPSDADEFVANDSVTVRGARVSRPQLRRGRSTVRGRVTTLGGSPIVGARVTVNGGAGMALTNERGEYTLTGQPAGSQTVVVRRLGYEPTELAVNLSPMRVAALDVTLAEFVPVLETVTVRGRREEMLQRVGFEQRKRAGTGRYMTSEEIARRNAFNLVDLLADFPMLRSISAGGTRRVITGRSRGIRTGCVTYYVDNMPWVGEGSPTDFMHPQEVGAIEVYTSSNTPAQFARVGMDCETVVIWTKMKLGMR